MFATNVGVFFRSGLSKLSIVLVSVKSTVALGLLKMRLASESTAENASAWFPKELNNVKEEIADAAFCAAKLYPSEADPPSGSKFNSCVPVGS